jgi:hypothetical protein
MARGREGALAALVWAAGTKLLTAGTLLAL